MEGKSLFLTGEVSWTPYACNIGHDRCSKTRHEKSAEAIVAVGNIVKGRTIKYLSMRKGLPVSPNGYCLNRGFYRRGRNT